GWVGAGGVGYVDLAGGAPELNPNFLKLVRGLRELGVGIQVRTNLAVYVEPGMGEVAESLREAGVDLVGSMPCYLEANVDAQRGEGVYARAIGGIRLLNGLGYGVEGGGQLNLVYNPAGASLPPDQGRLEADYRRELRERHGLTFTRLLTLANMPVGRFRARLRREGLEEAYGLLLRDAFNPATLEGLMCRRQVSVGWDGRLYDCDFNLALGFPVEGATIGGGDWDPLEWIGREIVMGEHCWGCTAGGGSSCEGVLVRGS
ncbi:MAG: DUF3641 domain-containing protein, partial [Magnetococcales bacterium]|nr:DUF3641 domain-containing protein [Magnetococcales bacterium]